MHITATTDVARPRCLVGTPPVTVRPAGDCDTAARADGPADARLWVACTTCLAATRVADVCIGANGPTILRKRAIRAMTAGIGSGRKMSALRLVQLLGPAVGRPVPGTLWVTGVSDLCGYGGSRLWRRGTSGRSARWRVDRDHRVDRDGTRFAGDGVGRPDAGHQEAGRQAGSQQSTSPTQPITNRALIGPLCARSAGSHRDGHERSPPSRDTWARQLTWLQDTRNLVGTAGCSVRTTLC